MDHITTARIDGQFADQAARGAHIATVWGMTDVADDMRLRQQAHLAHLHQDAIGQDRARDLRH